MGNKIILSKSTSQLGYNRSQINIVVTANQILENDDEVNDDIYRIVLRVECNDASGDTLSNFEIPLDGTNEEIAEFLIATGEGFCRTMKKAKVLNIVL